jgi:hypothetical protein
MRSVIAAIFAIAILLAAPGGAATKRTVGTIAPQSRIYVDSNNGFEIFIQAAFQAKRLPLQLVSTAEKADYILDSSLFHTSEFTGTTKAATTYRTSEAAF